MKITNQAAGPRGFNVKSAADGSIRCVLLQPGESVDEEPVPHAGFAGMIRAGDLVLGDGGGVERSNLSPAEMQARARRASEQQPTFAKALS